MKKVKYQWYRPTYKLKPKTTKYDLKRMRETYLEWKQIKDLHGADVANLFLLTGKVVLPVRIAA